MNPPSLQNPGHARKLFSRKPEAHRSSIDVIEEATGLLRSTPIRAWFIFYGSSIPFALTLIFFWSDMSRAPDAGHRLVPQALLLAVLFLLMKCGHAVFGDLLLSRLRRDAAPPPRLRFTQWLRLAATQGIIHATMPWLLSVSLIAIIPFAWTYAFYRSVSLIGCGHIRNRASLSSLIGRSIRVAQHAPKSNHVILMILFMVATLLWLNAMILSIFIPQLVGTLTGIKLAMNLSPWAMLNTTLVTTSVVVCWLVSSPISQALYAVRCFEADSLKSGEDLLAGLSSLRLPAALITGLICIFMAGSAMGKVSPPPVPPSSPRISQLNRALDHTLQEAEFRWRMPRKMKPVSQMGWFERTVLDFSNWLKHQVQSAVDAFEDFLRWLLKHEVKHHGKKDTGKSWLSDPAHARMILFGLLAGLVVTLIILTARWLAARRAIPKADTSPLPLVDLDDESILATDLPEDEWLRLANEKLAQGDARLALRALFLGILSHLGSHDLLTVAPGKTNGMYLRELNRRPRTTLSLRGAFAQSIRLFEHCWYGDHVPGEHTIEEVRNHHHTICHHDRVEIT